MCQAAADAAFIVLMATADNLLLLQVGAGIAALGLGGLLFSPIGTFRRQDAEPEPVPEPVNKNLPIWARPQVCGPMLEQGTTASQCTAPVELHHDMCFCLGLKPRHVSKCAALLPLLPAMPRPHARPMPGLHNLSLITAAALTAGSDCEAAGGRRSSSSPRARKSAGEECWWEVPCIACSQTMLVACGWCGQPVQVSLTCQERWTCWSCV